MDRNMKISLVWNRCVITLIILTSMRSVAFGSTDDVRMKSESSTDNELIFSYLRLPWIDGVPRLTGSNKSAHVEKVRSFIRSVEASEEWALQMLEDFSQSQREWRLKNIQEIDQHDQCSEDNDNAINSGIPTNKQKVQTHAESRERVAYGDFTRMEIFAESFISSVCAFVFAGTICDFIKRCSPNKVSTTVNTLAKFSLYKNGLKLLSTDVASDTMRAIHGLRFLSCFMVVTGHHYAGMIVLLRHKGGILDLLYWKHSWLAVYLSSTSFAVDTFFVISGFLTAYMFFMAKKSEMKFNLLTMYIYRYLRLTPCFGVLILLIVTLLHRVGVNHLSESAISLVIDSCKENWWTNFLYIQNIVNEEFMCIGQSWYMAADMQLFWISPIILYSLHRSPRIGLSLLGVFLIGSVSTSAFLLAINGYSNALLRFDFDLSILSKNIHSFYMSSVSHVFPYFVGIALGFDAATKKRCLTKANVAINWFAAGSLLSFCVWANYKVYNSNFAYNLWIEITLTFLLRPSWSVVIAWIIYACTRGYGGIATKFLSLPIFVPLSRLSYCIYLVHELVQGYYLTTSKIPTTFSGSEISRGIFVELITSIAAASVFCLFIESPVIVLVKMLTNRGRHQKQK